VVVGSWWSVEKKAAHRAANPNSPATSHQPPATSYQAPATGHYLAALALRRPDVAGTVSTSPTMRACSCTCELW